MLARAATVVLLAAACAGGPRASGLSRTRPPRLFSTLLQTDRLVDTDPAGLTLGVGTELLPGWRQPFSGLEGDLLRLPVYRLDVHVGGRVGLRLEGAAWERLDVDPARSGPAPGFESPAARDDTGALRLATVIGLTTARARRPAVGLVVGARLPTSDEKEGIGLDTIDIFGHLVSQWEGDGGAVILNLGVAILESPTTLQEQNDVVTWGVLGRRRLSRVLDLVGELEGRSSTRTETFPGTNDRRTARAGLAGRPGRVTWEVLLVHGMTEIDGELGLAAGIGWSWSRR